MRQSAARCGRHSRPGRSPDCCHKEEWARRRRRRRRDRSSRFSPSSKKRPLVRSEPVTLSSRQPEPSSRTRQWFQGIDRRAARRRALIVRHCQSPSCRMAAASPEVLPSAPSSSAWSAGLPPSRASASAAARFALLRASALVGRGDQPVHLAVGEAWPAARRQGGEHQQSSAACLAMAARRLSQSPRSCHGRHELLAAARASPGSGRHSRWSGVHRRGRAVLRPFRRPGRAPDRRSGRGRSASRNCRNSP